MSGDGVAPEWKAWGKMIGVPTGKVLCFTHVAQEMLEAGVEVKSHSLRFATTTLMF